MRGILLEYELDPTTWVYLSSLLTIGIYFKFRRFWSLRNLDLIALIAFSPGLLLIYHGVVRQLGSEGQSGQWLEQLGFIWLFGAGGFFLIRLLLDPILVRRPLLEPNLSAGGLAFMAVALLAFLMSNVFLVSSVTDPGPAQRLEHVLAQQQAPVLPAPGFALLSSLAGGSGTGPGTVDDSSRQDHPGQRHGDLTATTTARSVAILGHLAVMIGLALIGYRHFDNIHTGVATVALYLLLPYTAQMISRVDHVVPAALLVWAVLFYRRPVLSGILIGLAAGLIFYPLFLLPLWCGFYWRRGLWRFLIGLGAALLAATICLALMTGGLEALRGQLEQMFGWASTLPEDPAGFWDPRYHEPVFRIPVIAAFVALCVGLALWPAQKNLGTLLSCSAAVMLGVQFWHPYRGGLYVAWYLPLLLLTIFRPNLEDRVALSALGEVRIRRRKASG
ncbi:MAG: hypothetical protein ACYSWU_11885 [Planctomycetota bacterium]|jgi:hypothetical protein